MLTEDIERRWILSRRNYTQADVDLEADQYLQQHCIQPIQDLTKQSDIPYIAVSCKSTVHFAQVTCSNSCLSARTRYAGSLKRLTALTHEKVSEYFAQQRGMQPSPVPTVTAMAQRLVPWLNIEESIK